MKVWTVKIHRKDIEKVLLSRKSNYIEIQIFQTGVVFLGDEPVAKAEVSETDW